jgi:integrase
VAHIEKHRRRGGIVWRARYRGPDGAERSRTFARKSDAEAFLTKVEDAKLRGEWVDPSLGKTRVREYAEQWVTTKADVAPRTFVNIEARLRMHVVPYFGSMALNRVRPSHVRAFVAELVRAGYAPGTVKATYQIVAQIFAQAALDGLVARSPCVGVELPRDRRREEMCFLEPEQVNALANAIDDRYRALIYTAAYGGLRAGELGALTVRRLDLLARTLHVAESAGEVRSRLVVGPTKTGRVRTISLPSFLADMLGEHLGRYRSTAGWVFTAAEGGQVRHRNFYARHFRPAVARAGLPDDLRFHDLRHTCAAFLIAEGRHIEEVKDYLGHSSIRVTSDRYGHLFPKARRELAQALDARFRRAARDAPAACEIPVPGRRIGSGTWTTLSAGF